MPRLIIVADLDQDDLEDVAVEIQELVGEDSVTVVRYVPLDADAGGFGGVLDLATGLIHEYPAAPDYQGTYRPADPEHLTLTADARADLLTLVATHAVGDGALSAFVEGRTFDVAGEFAHCVSHGFLCPVLPAEAREEIAGLVDLIRAGRPGQG